MTGVQTLLFRSVSVERRVARRVDDEVSLVARARVVFVSSRDGIDIITDLEIDDGLRPPRGTVIDVLLDVAIEDRVAVRRDPQRRRVFEEEGPNTGRAVEPGQERICSGGTMSQS